ncbi:MAG: hypothetical protein GC193_03895 [Cryomorphaceae bacterium]|nr:hypothetical protein [Cryomorphaceae bacterium]
MVRQLISFGLFLASAAVYGQESSLLWRIEKDGQFEGYLFGTYHSSASFANSDSTFLFDRMEECSVFIPELDLTKAEEMAAELAPMMMFMEGLNSLYTEDEWVVIDAYFTEQIGAMRGSVYLLKPFWAMIMAENIKSMQSPAADDNVREVALILDVLLCNKAMSMGMPIRPLETPIEQMDAVNSIPLADQAKSLLEVVGMHEEGIDPQELLEKCYQSHDLNCLVDVYEEHTLSTSAEEALIEMRNLRMGERLLEKLEDKAPVFCAVGALHLPRYMGLIDQLDVAGYTLTPVKY